MCDNDNVVTDESEINKWIKNKGLPERNQLSLTNVWSCLLTINEPLPLQSSICYSQM
jgi:hypothetical protein